MYYTRSKMTTRSKTAWKGDSKTAWKGGSKVLANKKASKGCYTNSKTSSDPIGKKAPKKAPKRTITKKTSKRDMEAAHILVELYHAPPALGRTMSHTAEAEELARPFFEQCQEGETILANYFIDQSGIGHVDYYTRESGVIVMKHIREHEMVIRAMPWTYETTYFKL